MGGSAILGKGGQTVRGQGRTWPDQISSKKVEAYCRQLPVMLSLVLETFGDHWLTS